VTVRQKGRNYGERREWTAPAGYGLDVEKPIAGYYRMRLGSGTIKAAIRVWWGPPLDPVTGEVLDRSYRWQALANGKYVPLERVWPVCASDPITLPDYDYMLKRREWAQEHAPQSAYATGKKYDPLDHHNPIPF
jgi:hypothetical protein